MKNMWKKSSYCLLISVTVAVVTAASVRETTQLQQIAELLCGDRYAVIIARHVSKIVDGWWFDYAVEATEGDRAILAKELASVCGDALFPHLERRLHGIHLPSILAMLRKESDTAHPTAGGVDDEIFVLEYERGMSKLTPFFWGKVTPIVTQGMQWATQYLGEPDFLHLTRNISSLMESSHRQQDGCYPDDASAT